MRYGFNCLTDLDMAAEKNCGFIVLKSNAPVTIDQDIVYLQTGTDLHSSYHLVKFF